MTSNIAQLTHIRAQQNQVIAPEVRGEMLLERNAFEQHGAQDIIALKHMMAQFENQTHAVIKREAPCNCVNCLSESKCAMWSTRSGMKNQEDWRLHWNRTLECCVRQKPRIT